RQAFRRGKNRNSPQGGYCTLEEVPYWGLAWRFAVMCAHALLPLSVITHPSSVDKASPRTLLISLNTADTFPAKFLPEDVIPPCWRATAIAPVFMGWLASSARRFKIAHRTLMPVY